MGENVGCGGLRPQQILTSMSLLQATGLPFLLLDDAMMGSRSIGATGA